MSRTQTTIDQIQPHLTRQRSIVVGVRCTENTVFIAMPFGREFNQLWNVIEQAVIDAGLRPVRTDADPQNVSFVSDITQRIRQCKLVIAVCTPDPATGGANPNVTHELGLARSIGKATIVLTTDPARLPSDLEGTQAFVYSDDDDFGMRGSLVQRLTIRITTCLRQVTNGLTDAVSYPDIFVAESRHWMLLHPDLWDSYVRLLDFAKNVHHQFQDLDAAHLDPLLRIVNEVFTKAYNVDDLRRRQVECEQMWGSYYLFYNRFTIDGADRNSELEAAFKQLLDAAESDRREDVRTSERFFLGLVPLLHDYQNQHRDIANICSEGAVSMLASEPDTLKLWTKLTAISRTAKSIVIQADSLILNLIRLILQD